MLLLITIVWIRIYKCMTIYIKYDNLTFTAIEQQSLLIISPDKIFHNETSPPCSRPATPQCSRPTWTRPTRPPCIRPTRPQCSRQFHLLKLLPGNHFLSSSILIFPVTMMMLNVDPDTQERVYFKNRLKMIMMNLKKDEREWLWEDFSWFIYCFIPLNKGQNKMFTRFKFMNVFIAEKEFWNNDFMLTAQKSGLPGLESF